MNHLALENLIYWINERNRIYLAKEQGFPKPWSTNYVMQRTYFCNIHREKDRVTRWIRHNYTYEDFMEKFHGEAFKNNQEIHPTTGDLRPDGFRGYSVCAKNRFQKNVSVCMFGISPIRLFQAFQKGCFPLFGSGVIGSGAGRSSSVQMLGDSSHIARFKCSDATVRRPGACVWRQ